MAWEWSHSQDAYDDFRANVAKQERAWLECVYAEWEARADNLENFDEKKFRKALKQAKKLPSDMLADTIYEKAEAFATCEAGGHNGYACPFGCGPHVLPFAPLEEANEVRQGT
jgi:hypothetical protein